MPAEVEEVVVQADPFQLQHLRPYGGDRPLRPGHRLAVLGGGDRGGGQGPAVQLAVGGQRQGVQRDVGGGQHVLRQHPADGLTGLRGVLRSADQVGDQPLVLADHDRGLPGAGPLAQRRRDLTELDPQAAQLDLVVEPAQELHAAVGQPARGVAGAVQPVDEAFRGQLRAVVVAGRHRHPAQVQFTRHPDGRRLAVGVQDVQLGVLDGQADRHPGPVAQVLLGAVPGGDVDGGLGGAVQVVQLGAGQGVQAPQGQVDGEFLAATDDPAQRGAARHVVLGEEEAQHRGDEVDGGYRLGLDQLPQVRGVAVAAGRGQQQPGAGHERPEELPDRDVEAGRGLLQHGVPGGEPEPLLHPVQPVDDRPVPVGHALGPSGGARGVDQVGRRAWFARGLGRRRGEAVPFRGPVQQEDGRAGRAESRAQLAVGDGALGEHHRGVGVGQHERDAVRRVFGVQRHVGGAGLQDAEQPAHQLQGAFGADADQ